MENHRDHPAPTTPYLFYFKALQGSVFFDNNNISLTTSVGSEAFLDGTSIQVNLAASSLHINQTLAQALAAEKAMYRALTFTFKFNASLDEYYRDKNSQQHISNFNFTVSCDQLTLAFV